MLRVDGGGCGCGAAGSWVRRLRRPSSERLSPSVADSERVREWVRRRSVDEEDCESGGVGSRVVVVYVTTSVLWNAASIESNDCGGDGGGVGGSGLPNAVERSEGVENDRCESPNRERGGCSDEPVPGRLRGGGAGVPCAPPFGSEKLSIQLDTLRPLFAASAAMLCDIERLRPWLPRWYCLESARGGWWWW